MSDIRRYAEEETMNVPIQPTLGVAIMRFLSSGDVDIASVFSSRLFVVSQGRSMLGWPELVSSSGGVIVSIKDAAGTDSGVSHRFRSRDPVRDGPRSHVMLNIVREALLPFWSTLDRKPKHNGTNE